ncbi:MAG TPA: acetamidase/formamidase family protein [Candidatus Dormibacteraeota bacterium]|nr:acetamidase/formamidase family protein [Candidatus Dormibacteraeota bacterium]
MSATLPPATSVPKGAVRFTLGREHPPVVRVVPGTRLRIETELNIGDVLRQPTDKFEAGMLQVPYVNGATGPIAIEGATTEHALVCTIEEMELISPGFTALVPGVGAFPDWIRHRDFGVQSRVVEIKEGHVLWEGGLRIPVAPMVGVIGTAPLLESVSTIDNGPHGGNLDVQEMGPGTTVTLPVAVPEALFFLGDCHAVQGDGELCGCGAIEIRTMTTVTLDLIPRPPEMVWPRLETADHIGTVACARPLEDAFRLAVEELIKWMVADYGFSAESALLLLGQVAEARCTQMVNPKYTYVAKIAKRYLPNAPAKRGS